MRSVVHIEAPVEKVFDFFSDPRRSAELFPEMQVRELKMTDDGIGTYASYHSRLAGIPFDAFSVYTEVVRNKHITEKSSSAMVGTWAYDFEPEGTGTRVSMEHHSRALWGKPPLSMLGDLYTARKSESYLRQVKQRLETAAA